MPAAFQFCSCLQFCLLCRAHHKKGFCSFPQDLMMNVGCGMPTVAMSVWICVRYLLNILFGVFLIQIKRATLYIFHRLNHFTAQQGLSAFAPFPFSILVYHKWVIQSKHHRSDWYNFFITSSRRHTIDKHCGYTWHRIGDTFLNISITTIRFWLHVQKCVKCFFFIGNLCCYFENVTK